MNADLRTYGVSEQAAKEYLKTAEGMILLQRLIEGDPDAPVNEIRNRAIGFITSGVNLPRMEIINEPLVMLVPRGKMPKPHFLMNWNPSIIQLSVISLMMMLAGRFIWGHIRVIW
jgi:hypothetical protein